VALFARAPWCALCPKRLGKLVKPNRATIRDHKIPVSEGGTEDVENEQGLCQTCSDIKTREESARGVRRR